MSNTQSLQTPKLVGAVVITAVLMIGVYVLILNNKTSSAASIPVAVTSTTTPIVTATPAPTPTPTASATIATPTPTSTPPPAPVVVAPTTSYKDGTYSASANYKVPNDVNTIKVTLTVKGDVITAVDTQNRYGDRESVRYINSFTSALTGAVVGKKLDAAQLGRLNGASDTTIGFDQALTTIISQAKA